MKDRSVYNEGSSPLSRGILRPVQIRRRIPGIIPALAGNTYWVRPSRASISDHPRSRGEYPPPRRLGDRAAGSSPLSRGILGGAFQGLSQARIIPALAGNTCAKSSRTRLNRDHPRSRGEYGKGVYCEYGNVGSSPLSRGILRPAHRCMLLGGIIPALAGNTPPLKPGFIV